MEAIAHRETDPDSRVKGRRAAPGCRPLTAWPDRRARTRRL